MNPADGRAEFKGYYISAYSIARKNGFTGTEQEWLKSLEGSRGADGAPGEPGAPIVIRDMYGTLDELRTAVTTPNLGDMYAVGTESENVVYFWNGTAWVGLGAVKGADGAPGKDGVDGTPGADGKDGTSATIRIGTVTTGAAGSSAQVTNGGTESAAVLNFVIPRGADGTNGTDGREVELQVTSTYIQWRYAGDATWNNLVALSSLKGADGSPGAAGTPGAAGADGREVEIQATSTYIQWRYAGETTWNSLVALSSLKGADGAAGAPGSAGADGVGISGVAFKETDASGNNVYTITLTNGATYDFTAPKGATGSKGDTGATGPNSVSTSTATNITGLLKGNGSTVEVAVAGTDYAAASHSHSYIPTTAKGAANGVASLDADTKVTASQASAAVVSVSASTTLASSHAGRFLSCANTSGITVTIPTGIAEGTEIEIYRGGAGTVTLSPASGVTVECKESTYGIADQYTSVVLKWRTDSIVVLEGNVG